MRYALEAPTIPGIFRRWNSIGISQPYRPLEDQLFEIIYQAIDAEADWQDVQQLQDHLREGLENLGVIDENRAP